MVVLDDSEGLFQSIWFYDSLNMKESYLKYTSLIILLGLKKDDQHSKTIILSEIQNAFSDPFLSSRYSILIHMYHKSCRMSLIAVRRQ